MAWHRPRFVALVGSAFLLGSLACGPNETEGPPVDPGVAKPAAPAPTPPVPTPVAESAAPDPESGGKLYLTYCSSCHGEQGDGDGPVSAGLDPKPARHSDGATMNALSDEFLVQVIRDGGPAVGKSPLMAAWGSTLSDAEIGSLVAFVRTLADPPYEP